MQKWRKALIIFTLVMAIIGGLIGFAMGKTGLGKVKILGNLDVFSIFMFSLLVFMVGCLAFDIYKIHQGKKKFGNIKFEVTLKTRKRLRNVLIFFIVDTIFEFILFFTSIDMHILPACFMILLLTLMWTIHYITGDGISENGILHWGMYHSWSDIKSYKVENETLLEMNVLSKTFGFKYNNEIKFNFDREFKEHIESFLVEKL
ncbi:DUF5673 domain-containing protein [Clostridium sp.]|uniref:DUF5673 domain-containing protein n=1 Tax=Clostridium sp. TaxID=1506 RepID=UPI00262E525E|nr:DUF5673 domain-containing protein [Clostridium sp.]